MKQCSKNCIGKLTFGPYLVFGLLWLINYLFIIEKFALKFKALYLCCKPFCIKKPSPKSVKYLKSANIKFSGTNSVTRNGKLTLI